MCFDAVVAYEALAFLLGLIYIFRASRKKWDAWVFGILSCLLWAWLSYTHYKLLADAVLQLFYVAMGVYGLVEWKRKSESKTLEISRLNLSELSFYGIPALIISFIYAYCLSSYTEANIPILDSLTTVFSILATYWMIQRKIENWIFWIVLNSIYIYIYASVKAYFFVLMMIIYITMSVYGWISWKKELDRNHPSK